MPKRIMRDELEDLLMSLCDAVDWLDGDRRQKQKTVETHESTIAGLEARLAYYENPNAPPSPDSPEWKRQKRKKKAAAKTPPRSTAASRHGKRTRRFCAYNPKPRQPC